MTSQNKIKFDENNNLIEDYQQEQNESPQKKVKLTCLFKKKVFDYDSSEMYELLLQHGVSIFICDQFLSKSTTRKTNFLFLMMINHFLF
jgi:hypothetical protein